MENKENNQKMENLLFNKSYPVCVRNYALKVLDFLIKESKIKTLKSEKVRNERKEEIKTMIIQFLNYAKEIFNKANCVDKREAVKVVYRSLTTKKSKREESELGRPCLHSHKVFEIDGVKIQWIRKYFECQAGEND